MVAARSFLCELGMKTLIFFKVLVVVEDARKYGLKVSIVLKVLKNPEEVSGISCVIHI